MGKELKGLEHQLEMSRFYLARKREYKLREGKFHRLRNKKLFEKGISCNVNLRTQQEGGYTPVL